MKWAAESQSETIDLLLDNSQVNMVLTNGWPFSQYEVLTLIRQYFCFHLNACKRPPG